MAYCSVDFGILCCNNHKCVIYYLCANGDGKTERCQSFYVLYEILFLYL